MTEPKVQAAQKTIPPEARPSGVFRSIQARREKDAWATIILAGFATAVVLAAFYVVFG